MPELTDPDVLALLSAPNHAVLSTQNGDGSILSTVVWIAHEEGELFVNSALGRRWPTNLERDPHATVVIMAPDDPYRFVEIRGTVRASTERGLDDINRLSHKYVGRNYPWLQPGEQRVTFVLEPSRVRFVKV
ncbi:MAG TPA: TIGR03618 family F420-dependent PPOX class oxidoreductase [Solirubrobacteraceae bacterium]|nr:TIGR03618 family F420-dependent PPOX class oxidoreductase [Solirubrobacteraceae bacterium]